MPGGLHAAPCQTKRVHKQDLHAIRSGNLHIFPAAERCVQSNALHCELHVSNFGRNRNGWHNDQVLPVAVHVILKSSVVGSGDWWLTVMAVDDMSQPSSLRSGNRDNMPKGAERAENADRLSTRKLSSTINLTQHGRSGDSLSQTPAALQQENPCRFV
jgi:hypothetical protein